MLNMTRPWLTLAPCGARAEPEACTGHAQGMRVDKISVGFRLICISPGIPLFLAVKSGDWSADLPADCHLFTNIDLPHPNPPSDPQIHSKCTDHRQKPQRTDLVGFVGPEADPSVVESRGCLVATKLFHKEEEMDLNLNHRKCSVKICQNTTSNKSLKFFRIPKDGR